MLFGLSWSIILSCVFLTYLVHNILQWLLDPLRHVPGPFPARFTRFWYFYKILQGDFERTNITLHERFGPVVRIAPNEYSVNDITAAKSIYGHGSKFIKAPWYWAWMPPNPDQASLFADLNPQHHSIQRRKVASAYSMSSLISYEPFVDNCASLLISHFDAAADSGEITFGQRFGLLDDGIDKDEIFGAIDARSSYSTFIGIFPWLHQFLFPLQPTTGNHAYVAKYTKHHIALREKLYQSGEEKLSNGSRDFVSKFLDLRSTDSGITTTDIFTTCQSNIGAGSDTTAITISAVLYYLLKHPQTLRKLQSEIDVAVVKESITEHMSFKQSNQLPYLQAVIKEALRLHSATGLPLARLVPPSGVDIGEFHFRKGATVGINSWVAHRKSSIFGQDANNWRPERWLEFEEEGRGAEVEKYFLPFGMGSRTCIGKNLSLLEVSKLICELLRRFEFQLDEQILQKDWTTTNVWFVKPENFIGKVIKRHSK